jgi:hypothetical protein
MSDLAREAEENPEVWKSGTARFPDEERAEMIAWLTETISTGPVHALYQDSRPTKLVITDASAKGWAVTVVDPTTWVYDVVRCPPAGARRSAPRTLASLVRLRAPFRAPLLLEISKNKGEKSVLETNEHQQKAKHEARHEYSLDGRHPHTGSRTYMWCSC